MCVCLKGIETEKPMISHRVLNFINKIVRDIFLALFSNGARVSASSKAEKNYQREKNSTHTEPGTMHLLLFFPSTIAVNAARMVSIIEAIGMYHAGVSFPFR